MSQLGSQALPLSRKAIREYAWMLRQHLGLDQTPRVDVEELIDLRLPKALPVFEYEIAPKSVMAGSHGLALPDYKAIIIRDDVHSGACEGEGRDRFTIIHELGHILLHTNDRMQLRRGSASIKTYCDPEWQANTFAGEFLAPRVFAPPGLQAGAVATTFGLSVMDDDPIVHSVDTGFVDYRTANIFVAVGRGWLTAQRAAC